MNKICLNKFNKNGKIRGKIFYFSFSILFFLSFSFLFSFLFLLFLPFSFFFPLPAKQTTGPPLFSISFTRQPISSLFPFGLLPLFPALAEQRPNPRSKSTPPSPLSPVAAGRIHAAVRAAQPRATTALTPSKSPPSAAATP
uniref:Uncharacterized protein n=1 Tax=Oryza brachyantha TaxID=4533 RepID=J3MJG4_ORYBR